MLLNGVILHCTILCQGKVNSLGLCSLNYYFFKIIIKIKNTFQAIGMCNFLLLLLLGSNTLLGKYIN